MLCYSFTFGNIYQESYRLSELLLLSNSFIHRSVRLMEFFYVNLTMFLLMHFLSEKSTFLGFFIVKNKQTKKNNLEIGF